MYAYASEYPVRIHKPAKRQSAGLGRNDGGVGEAPSIHEVDPIARSRLYKIAHSARSICAALDRGRRFKTEAPGGGGAASP